jgi:hypothetical protein
MPRIVKCHKILSLSVSMPCVGMLNAIILYVTMLSVIMPGVGMLIVIMLSVINECCYAEYHVELFMLSLW